jgi:hypothetical protein
MTRRPSSKPASPRTKAPVQIELLEEQHGHALAMTVRGRARKAGEKGSARLAGFQRYLRLFRRASLVSRETSI